MKSNDLQDVLSPLERDILCIIWPNKSLRVRQIYEKLKCKRKLALSSVAVLLDRLHARGVVSRKIEKAQGGTRYVYSPRQNKEAFEKSVVESAVNKLIDSFGSTALSYFQERFRK